MTNNYKGKKGRKIGDVVKFQTNYWLGLSPI